MRIGLFTDTYTPDINGVVSSIVTLEQELIKQGHEVFVITNHKALHAQREGNVLRLPGMEIKWLYGYILSTPFHFSAREQIKEMNLDIIHAHTEFGVGIFARIISKQLDIPLVSTYHTMYEDYTHYINFLDLEEIDKVSKKVVSSVSKLYGETCQHVIAPSEKTKETLLRYEVKTPISIIPTGLNLEMFKNENIKTEDVFHIMETYGLSEEDNIVMFVGRIAKEKSIDIVIDGFRYVKNPHTKLMIVGGGPELKELKEQVIKNHLEDKVIFTDKKKREEIPAFYKCADAFVSASLTETQGMTYIEALASSLPVFARPDDVLEELIDEGKTGFYFNNSEEFAEKLDSYFTKNEQEINEIKQFAKDKVKCYDSKIFGEKVLKVYEQAIVDFVDGFQVVRIKASDDCVRIICENENEKDKKILVSIEDYFAYGIKKDGFLHRKQIEELEEKEVRLKAYRACLRKIAIKDRTKKEMQDYLLINFETDKQTVDEILKELEEKNLINDYNYMMTQIQNMQFLLTGKNKIYKNLMKKGISYEQIKEVLDHISDVDEKEKAMQMGEKILPTIRGKSVKMTQKMVRQKLISHGFNSSIADEVSKKLNYDSSNEKELLEKTILKAKKNYRNKYHGYSLKNAVIRYTIQKGFQSSDVLNAVNEMEWNDEEAN